MEWGARRAPQKKTQSRLLRGRLVRVLRSDRMAPTAAAMAAMPRMINMVFPFFARLCEIE